MNKDSNSGSPEDTEHQPEHDSEVGRVEVVTTGMIPPGLPNAIRPSTEGVVREGGVVDLSGIDTQNLRLSDVDAIEPGTEVRVSMRGKRVYCQPRSEYERQQQRKQRRRELEKKAEARYKHWERRRAEEFYDQYEIPFEWDVAIKGRRSGLGRGSWGDGRAADTVNHLFVCESFSKGRLERSAESYLCTPGTPEFQFTEERHLDGDDEEYRPKVTCKTCLERMERWKKDSEEIDEVAESEVADDE